MAIFKAYPSFDRVYHIMPTQEELQNQIDIDYAANRIRNYFLPDQEIDISGKFSIKKGISIIGRGYRDSYGTIFNLDTDGQVELESQSNLNSVLINQDANATVSALTNVDEARRFKAEDLKITGGNDDVWAMEILDHYEANFKHIWIYTNANGIRFPAPSTYSTGDSNIYDLRIWLHSPSTIGTQIIGSSEAQRTVNSLKFYSLQINNENPTWETDNCVGIDLQNTSRNYFFGANVEEMSTALQLEGEIGSGRTTSYINFYGGWLYDNIIANAGISNIKLFGTQLTGTITGDGVESVTQI